MVKENEGEKNMKKNSAKRQKHRVRVVKKRKKRKAKKKKKNYSNLFLKNTVGTGPKT